MPNKVHFTERDVEIITSLDRSPLTAGQLLKLSQTFGQPFTSERKVRARLQVLRQAGWVRSWPYATTTHGNAPSYYKPTLNGFHMVYGQDCLSHSKRHFDEMAIGRHHHTRCLADFIVHTAVAAHHQRMILTDFYRENAVRLDVGDKPLYPDCAFQLLFADGRRFKYYVELDNSTERVRSHKETDSWEQKIKHYDAYDRQSKFRYRVLVVTTRSRERRDNILEAAAQLIRNPRQRSLCYGIYLPDYLATENALYEPCFRDHFGRPISLLSAKKKTKRAPTLKQQVWLVEHPVNSD